MATSGEIRARRRTPSRLSSILNPLSPSAARGRQATASTTASGGASSLTSRRKSSSSSGEPSASMWTPSASLRTSPASPCRRARA